MALNKMLVGILSVFIAIVVCAGVMAPAISMAEQKTVFEQSNTSAIGIRFTQQTSDFSLDMSVSMDDQGNITVLNGNDSQTEPYDTMFLMAADNSAIYAGDGGPIAIWTSGGNNYVQAIDDDFTVQLGESNIEIVKGGDTYTLPLPTSYLFVPSSTGYYTSYLDGGLDKLAADPVVAISEVFAGVIAYNDISFGGSVAEQITGTSTYTDNVKWGAAAAPVSDIQNFDPSQIQFDPVIINPLDPGNQIMNMPSGTYTDGDWGYDLSGDIATITSYYGTGGDVVVPSTVGGYTVKTLGKGGSNENVFRNDDLSPGTTITISSGIETINGYVFIACSNISSVILPDTVTSMGSYVFGYASNIKNICLPSSLTSIHNSCFNSSGITNILNLSDIEITPGSYGLSSSVEIEDHLDAVCYIGHLKEISVANSPYNNILAAIPVIVIVAILLATAGMMLLRRE